jgi:3-oxoacyl-[acyl-carrier-protein] synthase-3
MEAGGSALPRQRANCPRAQALPANEGSEVFKFAVKIMGEAVDEALARAGLTADQIDLLIPHQAKYPDYRIRPKRYKLETAA